MTPIAGPPPPEADTRPPSDGAARVDPKALAALLLGLFGLLGACCGMGMLLGIPAVVLGIAAYRDIGRSAGGLRGRRIATAGIVSGAFGSMLFLGWALAVAKMLTPAEPDAVFAPLFDAPISASRQPIPFVAREETAQPRALALHRVGGPLRAQLAAQVAAARGAGETVLVETVVPDCDACDEIGRAMQEPEVQAALPDVRVVYVRMDEFRSELGWLRMDETTAPWFYLLDARGEPRDAIGADEWDDNDAANIGPVLRAFVLGKLQRRRHEWHGGATL